MNFEPIDNNNKKWFCCDIVLPDDMLRLFTLQGFVTGLGKGVIDQGASKEGENEGDSQQTEDTGEEGAENPEENSIRLPQIHKTTKVIKPSTSMSLPPGACFIQ